MIQATLLHAVKFVVSTVSCAVFAISLEMKMVCLRDVLLLNCILFPPSVHRNLPGAEGYIVGPYPEV